MMKNQLFSRLLHNAYGLEDFTSEVLAGVLRSNQALLDNFVNKVLGIKGRNFRVETQMSYQALTVDMVFSNKTNLCFLENQVHAIVEEQTHRLEKCEQILLTERQEKLNVYLRYCSKYYDRQSISGVDFAQFRWADISVFLAFYPENPLVSAFVDFLEENNMKGITELNTEDLNTISTLNNTIMKMDECLDSVAAKFTMLFGYPSRGAPTETLERLKLLFELNSYRMMKQDILLGGGGWSEITVCFDYEKLTGPETTLAVWYWCDSSHNQYKLLTKIFKQNKHLFSSHPGFLFEERPIGLRIILQKPLKRFENDSNQLQAIYNWFIETLSVFRAFSDKTPELHWNLPQ
ncbi:MAG: hypothetical protein DRR16_07750 [Candidatus Parabeggiatoa sp. nov. 3]|nr:MAG: hypothetical protein DRR00_16705 [Gammaproteobacteria bacterium]RKZ62560.1 MAG: hypothetical protein DRQ99_18525 [Gammaproteobacteria bacterium]RKZ87241.1 MAG: hypothetical protein DRR16_07750 [Gammaproteobacteria bacterium]